MDAVDGVVSSLNQAKLSCRMITSFLLLQVIPPRYWWRLVELVVFFFQEGLLQNVST